MTKLLSLILVLGCSSVLASCATSNKPLDVDYDMACAEILSEIDKTRQALYKEKTAQQSNAPAVASTAADVGVIGAGMAGVPYVGGIYSIGKTIFNHSKRTATDQADLHQIRLDELQYLAQRQQCSL